MRSRNKTPKVQAEEGSSSQPQKKRKKKVVETMLVDEPEEDEPGANVERDQDPVSPTMEEVLKDIDYGLESEKVAGEEGGNEEKSSSDSEKKRKRSGDNDDEAYVPSLEHVLNVQTPPSERIKKSSARKRVVSPAARKLRIKFRSRPAPEPQQPHQPSPPKQPFPPHQQPSPPHQPSPQSSPHLRMSTPLHEQPVITSPHIFQTPPTTQPPVHTTPGSSGLKVFHLFLKIFLLKTLEISIL
ncbi:hypothetical protein Hanom_Chr12g01156331 [Helianthus anomalus]